MRAGVESAIRGMDCKTLQTEYKAADARGAYNKARLGHDYSELMAYIDKVMTSFGCAR